MEICTSIGEIQGCDTKKVTTGTGHFCDNFLKFHNPVQRKSKRFSTNHDRILIAENMH